MAEMCCFLSLTKSPFIKKKKKKKKEDRLKFTQKV